MIDTGKGAGETSRGGPQVSGVLMVSAFSGEEG